MSEIIRYEIENSYTDYGNFETQIIYANKIWENAFGNTYDTGECPSNNIIVGYDNDSNAVSCAIFDIQNDSALISCVASNPTNIGNGTKLMYRLIEVLKDKNIKYAALNITLDENKTRLERFYEKFGFIHKTTDNTSHFDYDESIEIQKICYIMKK